MVNKQDILRSLAMVSVKAKETKYGDIDVRAEIDILKDFILTHVREFDMWDEVVNQAIDDNVSLLSGYAPFEVLSHAGKVYVYDKWARHHAGVSPV